MRLTGPGGAFRFQPAAALIGQRGHHRRGTMRREPFYIYVLQLLFGVGVVGFYLMIPMILLWLFLGYFKLCVELAYLAGEIF